MRRAVAFVVSLVAACQQGTPPASSVPTTAPAAPAAPEEPDGRYEVQGLRHWYLVGDAVTPGDDRLELTVTAPAGVERVELWIDGVAGESLARDGVVHRYAGDISKLGPGSHELVLAAAGARTGFAHLTFLRSHALYVLLTTDWDTSDHGDDKLARQETLHASHAGLRITHFVGPYTFTDPAVGAARRKQLVGWVQRMRDSFQDEIGLHIHPYCNFVTAAGVTCRKAPSYAAADGDVTGYTVVLSSYSEQETRAMLAKSDELFTAAGLGKPTSFRAGGWTAELHTMRALAGAGFVADTSAVNWKRMEEWSSRPGATLYQWNEKNWSTIDERSQPYYPSQTDLVAPASPPNVGILEVPDNGIMVDYVTGDEMIDMFHTVWGNGPVTSPTTYVIGLHPINFDDAYLERLDEALTDVDRSLHAKDAGPVVYTTVSEMAKLWPRP